MPESTEHRKLKEIMKAKLNEWLKGLNLKEYPVTGYEADVYGITQNNVIVHAEIIWSPSEYEKNIISLLISDADVKVTVFSPQTLSKFERDYNKVRLEQLKRGFFFSGPIEGTRLLENDVDYIEAVHKEIVQAIRGIPTAISPPFPRSYWFINEEVVRKVTSSLRENEWEKFPLMSQLFLLEEKYVVIPKEIDHEIGTIDENLEYTTIEDFDWNKQKKLLKFFGRFYTPFGVKEESISQFILDPCYFRYKKPYSLNIHIQPTFIRSDLESGSLLGLDKWQKPSIFIIGLLKHFEPWQPYVIEPLIMFTSEEESADFHAKLIAKKIEPVRDRDEFGFEFLSEEYGIDKAGKVENAIEREVGALLSIKCWENPPEIRELYNLFSIVPELLKEKSESDALRKILGYAFFSSLEFAGKMIEESKSFLMEAKDKYHSLLLEILNILDPTLNLEELISRGIAFDKLALKILKEGRLRILEVKQIDSYPLFDTRVSLILDKRESEFLLEHTSDDGLEILKSLCGK
jgi:hypothetical protein